MKNTLISRARRGFTLVEMLVVIAIIALLAGIAFPVFSKAREGARRASCANNLKQLGFAFQQYLQENNRYPGPGNYYAGAGFAGDLGTWKLGGNWVSGESQELADPSPPFAYVPGRTANVEGGAIYPYVKTPSVYFCPSLEDGQKKRLSYSMNCALGFLGSIRVTTPSDIVVLVDEQNANDGYFYAVDDSGATGSKSGAKTMTGSTDEMTKVHNGGGNLLFADGHVKFFTFKNFPLDKSTEGLTNKWRDTGAPRFHDKKFGSFGSNKSPDPAQTTDICNATKRDP